MQRYLLNEVTGVICLEGTSDWDVVVRAEEIEIDGGFQLRGVKADGTTFTATLSVEDYFNGKEFIVDEPVAETTAPEMPEADAVALESAIVESVKEITAELIKLDNRALNVKTKKDKKQLEADLDVMISTVNNDIENYGEQLRALVKKGVDVSTIIDIANSLYDHKYILEDMAKGINKSSTAPVDKYTTELISLNID